jgi:hypothetical protein
MSNKIGITWEEASEIASGLVITGKVASSAVQPESLFPPYNELVKFYQEGNREPEKLIQKAGISIFQASTNAIHSLNGASALDWLGILEETRQRYQIGSRLEVLSKKLKRGECIDGTEIRHVANQFGQGKSGRTSLDQIDAQQLPFVETGYAPLDRHLGGMPITGLIVVGGNPGIGKTTWAINVTSAFINHHQDKKVAFYSLEMMLPEIAMRFQEVSDLSNENKKRILINCDPLNAHEIISDASAIDNLGLVVVDFMDFVVRGELSESTMSSAYLALAIGAKQLGVPLIALAQFSYKYQGGIPKPTDIRWSKSAEILAWMQIMLYSPEKDYYAEDTLLPIIDNVGYMVVWKVRGGFRLHREESPGAIQLPFSGTKGWGWHNNHYVSGKWFSLKNI